MVAALALGGAASGLPDGTPPDHVRHLHGQPDEADDHDPRPAPRKATPGESRLRAHRTPTALSSLPDEAAARVRLRLRHEPLPRGRDTRAASGAPGRYRPALNELDCVGVVVVEFTPSLVVFRLGAFYAAAKLVLAPNDAFTIGVNSARFHGHVRYR